MTYPPLSPNVPPNIPRFPGVRRLLAHAQWAIGPALMATGVAVALARGPGAWRPAWAGDGLLLEITWMALLLLGNHLRLHQLPSPSRWLAQARAVQESRWADPRWAWTGAFLLSAFFASFYFAPEIWSPCWGMGEALSQNLRGRPADAWFFYGLLYTLVVLLGSMRMFRKHRGDAYQIWRTRSVVAFQLVFAFLAPAWLEGWMHPNPIFSLDIKYFWPLNHTFFEPWHLDAMRASGALGRVFLVAGVLMFLVVAPWATWRWGKGWYCSWMCGCGGLAETAGDAFRHKSDSRPRAWKWERWAISGVLAWITLGTGVVLGGYLTGISQPLGIDTYTWFSKPYALVVASLFSGVAGVGFYPLLGNRFWCRFGCPLAAYMGIFQRFASRFRVATDGGDCIACGQCTVQCEMGIDVRAYALAQQPVVRAGCVGCGICTSVCPRGVLRLETVPAASRERLEPWPLTITPTGIALERTENTGSEHIDGRGFRNFRAPQN